MQSFTIWPGVLLCASLAACSRDHDTTVASMHPALSVSAADGPPPSAEASSAAPVGNKPLSFFVSSRTNPNADLGGLSAADARCQTLAKAVGAGGVVWHAYLSVEHDLARANAPTNARDRIGQGPWYNANGVLVAPDLTALHARLGDADVFVDEHGRKINGHWPGSLAPLEHDVLTGSDAEGRLKAGMTCGDWTSASGMSAAQVGHTDGIGPNGNTSPPYSSWNSAHASQSCADTAPRGGAGRIYCFAVR
jgi:hypothetical protein